MYKKKKILAVVLARGGSKGIKNKNLKKLNGTSLVGRVGMFVKKIKIIDTAIISTDSIKIGKEALKYKLGFNFLRPKFLSGDKVSDEKVLYHALNKTEKIFGHEYDVIISLPPTSPLRDKNDINLCIKKLIDKKFDAVWTISKTDKKFHPFKSLVTKKNKLKFFFKEGHKIKYRQQLNQTFYRNGACYVFSRKSILKKKIITNNSSYVISKKYQISIDNITDLYKAAKLFSKK